MYLYCPSCQSQFPAGGHCPRCSSRLLSPSEFTDGLARVCLPPPSAIRASGLNRFIVGTVVAFGLHIALREWAFALMAWNVLEPIAPASLNYSLWFLALLVGALLAGAGRSGAFIGGLAVGIMCALAWLIADSYPHVAITLPNVLLAMAMLVAGGVSAYFGNRIWPSAIELPKAPLPRRSSILSVENQPNAEHPSKPMQWLRILGSTVLIVVAVLGAESVRTFLGDSPSHLFQVNGPAAPRVTFELTTAMVLISAMFSGAGTGAGLRHAIVTAVLSSTVILGLFETQSTKAMSGLNWYLTELGPEVSDARPQVVLAGTCFVAITIAGWLGGQLFPALSKRAKKVRRYQD